MRLLYQFGVILGITFLGEVLNKGIPLPIPVSIYGLLLMLFLSMYENRDPIARGLAIGTSSHAMGTAKAIELGEMEGAVSSLSIVVSGLFTVLFAYVFAKLL